MEIPKSSEIHKPFLEFLAIDGKDHRLPECVSAMGKHFHLSQSQMKQEFVKTKQKSKQNEKHCSDRYATKNSNKGWIFKEFS